MIFGSYTIFSTNGGKQKSEIYFHEPSEMLGKKQVTATFLNKDILDYAGIILYVNLQR